MNTATQQTDCLLYEGAKVRGQSEFTESHDLYGTEADLCEPKTLLSPSALELLPIRAWPAH